MSNLNTAIIITFDQLGAHFLGPYGNSLVETPHFNRLASQSLLFDFAFSNELDLNRWFDRIWSDQGPTAGSREQAAWTDAVNQLGYESVLITDDPQVAAHRFAKFDRVISIDQPEVQTAASDLSETQLANFFAQAIACLDRDFSDGQVYWIHCRGLAGAWDAPQAWREYFADEDDPDPPRFVNPPAIEWAEEEINLDQILGWQQAAAAQVQLIDQCLGIFLDQLQQLVIDQTQHRLLLGVAGCRGFALGEHQRVGSDQRFYNENIHVPLMFSTLSASSDEWVIVPGRSMAMVTTELISPILLRWLDSDRDPSSETQTETSLCQKSGQPLSETNAKSLTPVLSKLNNEYEVDFWLKLDCPIPDFQHDFILLANADAGFHMLQTHAWKIICGPQEHIELYAKPEDRWEVNEISGRCPTVVEELKALIQQVLSQMQDDKTHRKLSSFSNELRIKLPLDLCQRID